jgi:tetratricopeptide (TPR) repeat protein
MTTDKNKLQITRVFFGLLLLITMLDGCVTTAGTAKPNPALAARYFDKGRQLEGQGDLPAALEQYKLALTADPKNDAALQKSQRLTEQLSKLADERYELGLKYQREGKYALARTQFLIALKYRPDHPGASQMLTSRQPGKSAAYVLHKVQPGESLSSIAKQYYGDYKKYNVIAQYNHIQDVTIVRPGQTIMIPNLTPATRPAEQAPTNLKSDEFVLHTVKAGESVSKLAMIYYGDYKKFHIIAQYNHMDDATLLKAGDQIKIPKVSGLPFNQPGEQAPAMPAKANRESPERNTTAPAVQEPGPSTMQVPEPLQSDELSKTQDNSNDEVLAYRDAGIALYNEGKYEDAILELNKTVEAMPDDSQTRSYLAKAYFELGKSHLNQKEYDSAKESFESALQFDPACAECKHYIEKSDSGPLLAFRAKGIDHFNRNEFGEAIAILQQYLQLRPDDSEARTYLGKAFFEKALVDYNKSDFLAAKKGFESAGEYDSHCEKCAAYIQQSLESHKETHYNKGVAYYGKQQLDEAISEWQMVYDLDPGYKDVAQNLKKARALMQKLQQIKKSRQQQK